MSPLTSTPTSSGFHIWDWLMQIGGAFILFLLTWIAKDFRKRWRTIGILEKQVAILCKDVKKIKKKLGLPMEDEEELREIKRKLGLPVEDD